MGSAVTKRLLEGGHRVAVTCRHEAEVAELHAWITMPALHPVGMMAGRPSIRSVECGRSKPAP